MLPVPDLIATPSSDRRKVKPLLEIYQMTKACGEECAKHSMEHCQQCAQACRRCADECRRVAGQTRPGTQQEAGARA